LTTEHQKTIIGYRAEELGRHHKLGIVELTILIRRAMFFLWIEKYPITRNTGFVTKY